MLRLPAKALQQGGGAEIPGAFYKEQDFPPLPPHSMDACSLNQSARTQRDIATAGTMRWAPEWGWRSVSTYKGLSFH